MGNASRVDRRPIRRGDHTGIDGMLELVLLRLK
jgi:hypothetical protein